MLAIDSDFPRLLTGTGAPPHGMSQWCLHMTTSGFLLEHHRALLPLPAPVFFAWESSLGTEAERR